MLENSPLFYFQYEQRAEHHVDRLGLKTYLTFHLHNRVRLEITDIFIQKSSNSTVGGDVGLWAGMVLFCWSMSPFFVADAHKSAWLTVV